MDSGNLIVLILCNYRDLVKNTTDFDELSIRLS